jgi:hypothetical protein
MKGMAEVPAAAINKPREASESDLAVAMSEAAERKGITALPRVIGEYRGKHVFRSEQGKLRGRSYTMDCLKPTWEEPDDDPLSRRIAKISLQRWNKRHDDEQKAMLAQALIDNQGRKIKFKYVGTRTGHTGHVELETNSDAIAYVLNRAIRAGELEYIYYIDQSKYLKVGDKAFATNETGWKLAQAEATATGNSIEIIAKDQT